MSVYLSFTFYAALVYITELCAFRGAGNSAKYYASQCCCGNCIQLSHIQHFYCSHRFGDTRSHPFPLSHARTCSTGKIAVADKRPGSGLYVLLCTVVTTDIYTVKEPTYFVKSEGADGSFALPGIPPATYSLYIFGASGSITDQRRIDGIVVNGTVPTLDLGTITLTPFDNGFTHLWALGQSDRMSTEFNLGTVPRSYTLWNEVRAIT